MDAEVELWELRHRLRHMWRPRHCGRRWRQRGERTGSLRFPHPPSCSALFFFSRLPSPSLFFSLCFSSSSSPVELLPQVSDGSLGRARGGRKGYVRRQQRLCGRGKRPMNPGQCIYIHKTLFYFIFTIKPLEDIMMSWPSKYVIRDFLMVLNCS